MTEIPGSRTRRSLLAALGSLAIFGAASAQDSASTPEGTPASAPIESTTTGDLPSSGAMRPGPVGENSPMPRAANASAPATIKIEKAGIDAQIEQLNIVDGVMENPTGPWTVAWYQQTATLGEPGNVVLAGHVDYWNVGPSVFFNLRDLVAGDKILLISEDNRTYEYALDWLETFTMEELISGKLQEVVGTTESPSLTLITCGGEFDYVNGEYLSRMVGRASFVPPPAATPASTPGS